MTKKYKTMDYIDQFAVDRPQKVETPKCKSCNTLMTFRNAGIYHDKFVCSNCDSFSGIPINPSEYSDENMKKNKYDE